MSTMSTQIMDLVGTKNISASDMSHAAKLIGDGDMQQGFRKIARYFKDMGYLEGSRHGWIKGSVTTLVVGAVVWGGVQIKRLYDENQFRKRLERDGEAIEKAFRRCKNSQEEEVDNNA